MSNPTLVLIGFGILLLLLTLGVSVVVSLGLTSVVGVLELFHRRPLPVDADWLEFLLAFAVGAAVHGSSGHGCFG